MFFEVESDLSDEWNEEIVKALCGKRHIGHSRSAEYGLVTIEKMDYQEVYYNDYAFDQIEWGGIERCQWAVDELLKQAIDEELIDGIGIQAHIEKPDYADAVIEDAKIICAAGIKCQITELDINVSDNNESSFERL